MKAFKVLAIVAVFLTATIFAFRYFARRKDEQINEELADVPSSNEVMPIFPTILVSEVKGVASITKNLGNIRASADSWTGKIGEYKGFVQFSDHAYGVRALLKNLLTYYSKHGLKTVTAIITRWAPPSENNTDAYISNVCLWAGLQSTQQLTTADIVKLAPAIIRMEVGIPDNLTPYLKDYVSRVNSYFKVV